jgi:hypothetical protein
MIKDLNKAFKVIEVLDEDLFKAGETKDNLPKQLHLYKCK